jgi:hypothetical protein
MNTLDVCVEVGDVSAARRAVGAVLRHSHPGGSVSTGRASVRSIGLHGTSGQSMRLLVPSVDLPMGSEWYVM